MTPPAELKRSAPTAPPSSPAPPRRSRPTPRGRAGGRGSLADGPLRLTRCPLAPGDRASPVHPRDQRPYWLSRWTRSGAPLGRPFERPSPCPPSAAGPSTGGLVPSLIPRDAGRSPASRGRPADRPTGPPRGRESRGPVPRPRRPPAEPPGRPSAPGGVGWAPTASESGRLEIRGPPLRDPRRLGVLGATGRRGRPLGAPGGAGDASPQANPVGRSALDRPLPVGADPRPCPGGRGVDRGIGQGCVGGLAASPGRRIAQGPDRGPDSPYPSRRPGGADPVHPVRPGSPAPPSPPLPPLARARPK